MIQTAAQCTYSNLSKWLAAKGVVDLVLPVALYPREDVLLRDILDLGNRIVVGVVLEDDTQDLVL